MQTKDGSLSGGKHVLIDGQQRMKFIKEEDESDSFLPIGEAAGDMKCS